MTKLKEIDISNNSVTSFPSRGIATLTNLETLILGGNQVSHIVYFWLCFIYSMF